MTDKPMASSQYVTALFDDQADAQAAIERIVAEGIPREDIRMVAGAGEMTTAKPESKGFFGSLADMFMPDEDRYTYAEGLNRGGYLVSLNTTPENQDLVLDILDDEGTIDMNAREESWRAEGWKGYQESGALRSDADMTDVDPVASDAVMTGVAATGAVAASAEPRAAALDDGTIEVMKENLRVGKRQVDQGRVRVRSYIVETPVEEDISLRAETVSLERKAVDRPVTGMETAFAERVIEASETREEAVVSKEARVVEEINLGKSVDTRTETIRDTVRHTEVEVEDERLTDRTK